MTNYTIEIVYIYYNYLLSGRKTAKFKDDIRFFIKIRRLQL